MLGCVGLYKNRSNQKRFKTTPFFCLKNKPASFFTNHPIVDFFTRKRVYFIFPDEKRSTKMNLRYIRCG